MTSKMISKPSGTWGLRAVGHDDEHGRPFMILIVHGQRIVPKPNDVLVGICHRSRMPGG